MCKQSSDEKVATPVMFKLKFHGLHEMQCREIIFIDKDRYGVLVHFSTKFVTILTLYACDQIGSLFSSIPDNMT